MAANADLATGCPFDADRDDRKSAGIAAERLIADPRARRVTSFALARDLLRSRQVSQASNEQARTRFKGDRMPVFFLEGEPHRQSRGATARFFTPRAVTTRHRAMMEQTSDALMARLQRTGEGRLDDISLEMAVTVAAEIIGLTNSSRTGMTRRIGAFFDSSQQRRIIGPMLAAVRALNFQVRDVLPAISARRREKGDDLISHLVEEGYSAQEILIECMTYASAGMITTREFIVMSAWHLFERDDLRDRYMTADEAGKLVVLSEILRLEPVAGMLYRRTIEPMDAAEHDPVPAGTLFAIDIHAVNNDPLATGACPHSIDPDRGATVTLGGSMLSFGDGHHRCPGWQVAMHETMIFLDRLFELPGIRLKRAPDVLWCEQLTSYELRGAVVVCDRR